MSRKVAILGATGSVGRSTLDLIERSPERFEVTALTASTNVDALVADLESSIAEAETFINQMDAEAKTSS